MFDGLIWFRLERKNMSRTLSPAIQPLKPS